MPEGYVPLYDLLGSGPSAYALTSTYIVFALPIAAGLALLAKRIIGQASSRMSIGIISAVLWTILLAVHWAAPQFSSQVLPIQLSALVFILLFSGTLFEWLITAYRSRLRPFVNDAFVIVLIAALPVTLSAASSAAVKVCEDSFGNRV